MREFFICHGKILRCLSDKLYDVFCATGGAREHWKTLEKKYSSEKASPEAYTVHRFLEFKMVDDKSVLDQTNKLQAIIHGNVSKVIPIVKKIQVAEGLGGSIPKD